MLDLISYFENVDFSFAVYFVSLGSDSTWPSLGILMDALESRADLPRY